MARGFFRALVALSLLFVSPAEALTRTSPTEGASASARIPQNKRGPNLVGSGLRLVFPGKADKPYCLVSDTCVHVNALLAAVETNPSETWAKGYGIRTGEQSLLIQVEGASSPEELPSISFTFNDNDNANATPQHVWNLQELADSGAPPKSIVTGPLTIEDGGVGSGSILVTVTKCNVRLLIFAQKGWTSTLPRLSLDVLDWDSLDAPHGIMGQIFPNRASPDMFTAARTAYGSGNPAARRLLKDRPQMSFGTHRREVAHYTRRLSTSEAIRRLYSLKPATFVLDGEPDDYISSDSVEADCIFSRFSHEETTLVPKGRPWRPWGESLRVKARELGM